MAYHSSPEPKSSITPEVPPPAPVVPQPAPVAPAPAPAPAPPAPSAGSAPVVDTSNDTAILEWLEARVKKNNNPVRLLRAGSGTLHISDGGGQEFSKGATLRAAVLLAIKGNKNAVARNK